MHHRTIEQLAAGDSPIHRLDPRVKLVVALTFVLALGLLPGWPPQRLAPLAGLVVLGLALARLPWSFVLGRTALLLPFVGLMALLLPLTRGQHPLVHWEALDLVVYREAAGWRR
jgi:cobalt/nickel transport system permease protein